MIVTFHDIFQFSIYIFKTTFHPKLLQSRDFSVKSRILLSFSQQKTMEIATFPRCPTVPHGAPRCRQAGYVPDDAEKAAPAAATKAAAPAAPEVETVQATEGSPTGGKHQRITMEYLYIYNSCSYPYNGKMVIYNT